MVDRSRLAPHEAAIVQRNAEQQTRIDTARAELRVTCLPRHAEAASLTTRDRRPGCPKAIDATQGHHDRCWRGAGPAASRWRCASDTKALASRHHEKSSSDASRAHTSATACASTSRPSSGYQMTTWATIQAQRRRSSVGRARACEGASRSARSNCKRTSCRFGICSGRPDRVGTSRLRETREAPTGIQGANPTT